MFHTMGEVREANRAIGHHFFDGKTLGFFGSRIGRTLYGGRYFVTSEDNWDKTARGWTVREVDWDGRIGTVGGFLAYSSHKEARAEAKRLATPRAWVPGTATTPSRPA